MKLTCSWHSLLREAARRTFVHVYCSVGMQLAGTASEVGGRIGIFLYYLQEIVYVLCQLETLEHSFLLPLMTIVECKVTSRQLSILRLIVARI